MRKLNLFIIFVLGLALVACGGDDGGGRGTKSKAGPKVVNPWAGISSDSLSEEVDEQYRALEFSDGMLVSYNGGINPGDDERVCRREQEQNGDGDTVYHEVCMNLEDDPYFIAPENFSVGIWHPLMFNRFATDLTCNTWTVSVDENGVETVSGNDEPDNCFEVLANIGGEDFNCEAGLVNGDKALRCTDDWAVVVNGDDDASKTVCRVHLSNNSGRCLGAPKADIEDANLILEMQRTSWEGYRSNQDNPEQFGAGDSAEPLSPQDLPAGAQLSYASENEDLCMVDTDDSDGGVGSVMVAANAAAPTSCRIFVTVEADGFADRVLFVEIPILKANDLAWEDYRRSNNYFYPGETLVARAASSTDPASTENEYASLSADICSVDEDSGEITAKAAGECMIELTGTADGYLDRVIQKTVQVDAPREVFERIHWADFNAINPNIKAGESTVAMNNPPMVYKENNVAVDAGDVEIMIASADESVCTWDGDTKMITFINAEECVMAVTARGINGERGAAKVIQDFALTPELGELADVTGLAYADTAVYGGDALAVTAPTAPAGATFAYSASGGGCEVDAASGELTILAADRSADEANNIEAISCMVVATASQEGYEDKASDPLTVAVAKAAQVLIAPDNPYNTTDESIANDTVAGKASVLPLVNAPEGGEGELTYSAAGSCRVDASTGELTGGDDNDGTGNDDCVVSAAWGGNENYAASPAVAIATFKVADSDSGDANKNPDPVGLAYTGAKVGASVDPAALTNASDGGDAEYRGGPAEICTVDASSGALTGVTMGDCMVAARFVGSNGKLPSEWTSDVTVEVGKGDHPALVKNNPYGASPKIQVGNSLALVNPPVGKGAATYANKGDGTYCTVAGDGTVMAVAAGNCEVTVVFAGDENYNALAATDLATITVVAESIQSIAVDANPYGADPSLGLMGSLELVNGATASGRGAISYASEDAAICTVDASTGEITGVAIGECMITVSAEAVAAADPLPAYAAAGPVDFFTITVGEGDLNQIVTWAPERDARFGADFVLAEVNVGGTGAAVVYEIEDERDSGCAFKGNSGADARTLVFADFGACVVKASATAANYKGWERSHFVRTLRGQIIFSGSNAGFASNAVLTVGNSSALVPTAFTLNPSDADVAWELARGERDCVLNDASTGEVEALASAYANQENPACSVRMVAQKDGYGTWRSEITSVALEKGSLGDISPPVLGSNGQAKTGLPVSGGSVEMIRPPRPVMYEGGHLRIVSVVASGTDKDDTAKEGVCAFDEDSGHVSVVYTPRQAVDENDAPVTDEQGEPVQAVDENGQPLFDTAAAVGDKCVVTFTLDALGYEEVSSSVTLAITGGNFGFFAVVDGSDNTPLEVKPAYATNLKVGDSTAIALDTANAVLPTDKAVALDANGDMVMHDHDDDANTDDVPQAVTVAWATTDFYAKGKDADGNDKDSVCLVNADNGGLSVGSAAAPGDVCLVFAIAKAANYEDFHSLPAEVAVDAGELDTTGISKPTYATLRPGISVEPVLPNHAVDGNSVAVTWGNWDVVGDDVDGADDTTDSDVCSIDADGVVTAGSAASASDTCVVSAKISNPNYEDSAYIPVATLTVAAEGTFDAVSAPVYSGTDLALRSAGLSVTTAPVATEDVQGSSVAVDSAVITYELMAERGGQENTADDICAIDENSGMVSLGADAMVGDICSVVAIANAPGFAEKKATAVALTVSDSFTTFAWNDFPTSGAVGTTIDLSSNQPVVVPSDATVTVAVASGDCTYDATSGSEALTFTDTTECVVTATAEKAGLATLVDTYRVTPTAGMITVTSWGAYSGVKVDADANAPSVTISHPTTAVTKTYSSLTAGHCTVSGAGVVTGVQNGSGNCEIKLVLSKTGFADEENTYTVDVAKGTWTTAPAWAGYTHSQGANKGVFGGTPPALAAPTSTPTSTWTYSTSTGSVCGIAANGALTVRTAGNCTVKAVPSKDYYVTHQGITHTVVIAKASQLSTAIANWSEPYGANPSITFGTAGSKKAISATKPTGQGAIEFKLHSGDRSFCTIGRNSGEVTLLAAGAGQQCLVQARFAGNTNYMSSNFVNIATINTSKGTFAGVAWSGYGAGQSANKATFGDSALTANAPASTPTATWTYSTTSANTICTLNTANGTLTVTGAGSCVVKAVPSLAGYNTHAGVTNTVVISKKDQTAPTAWNAYAANLAVGAEAISASTTGAPTGQGALEYQVLSADSNYCTVTAAGQVTARAHADIPQDCAVQARFAGNTNYAASSYATIDTVRIVKGTIAVAGSNDAAKWGTYGSVAVGAATSAPNTGAITPNSGVSKAYASGDDTKCTVVESTGAVTGVATGTDNCAITLNPLGDGLQ